VRTIAEAVTATLRTLGLQRGVERARALQAWPAAATVVLGAEAARSRAVRLDGETLVVGVASPVLAQELRLHQQELLQELARLAPAARVRALRFVPR
jgi:predicted nucleic acid-binding Zn ribbon protein